MIEFVLAAAIVCRESHPGIKRPDDWAWRTIDGRPCWYQGPKMLPKDRLYWPAPLVEEQRPPTVTEQPKDDEDDGSFEKRWKGVR